VGKSKSDDILYLAHKLAMKRNDQKLKKEKLNLVNDIENINTENSMLSNKFYFFQSSHALGQFDNANFKKNNMFISASEGKKNGAELSNLWGTLNSSPTAKIKTSHIVTNFSNYLPVTATLSKYDNFENMSKLPSQKYEIYQPPFTDISEYKKVFLKVVDTGYTVRLLYRNFSGELNINKIDQYVRQHPLFDNKPIQLIFNGFKRTINGS